jgi:hypothetical protein
MTSGVTVAMPSSGRFKVAGGGSSLTIRFGVAHAGGRDHQTI